jgi:hypothetical protein
MMNKTLVGRPRTAVHIAAVGAALLGSMLIGSAPAHASVPPKCQISHDLYQQLGSVNADVEAPANEACHVGPLSLKVYRNGVLFADIWGSYVALNFQHTCVGTAPTAWSTNWDAARTYNCG